MKKTLLLLLVVSCSLIFMRSLIAQPPPCCAPPLNQWSNDGFNYQTVVRDKNGNVLMNKNISIEIGLSSDANTYFYLETFSTTTNKYGLINLTIGKGDSVKGKFSTIDWSQEYLICVLADTVGNSNFQLMGCSQLMSVPYTFYAKTAGTLSMTGTTGQTIMSDGTNWAASSNLTNNGTNVGIGTDNPQAKLDISSKTQGLLVPRMTTVERDAISSPISESTLIYNTDTHCFEAYYASTWTAFGCLLCKNPTQAGSISGPKTLCQGQTEVIYSVAAIANATGYNWTLPTGAAITSGINTSSITVSYSASAISGNISVIGTNACGNGASSSITVTVNQSPIVTSPLTASICSGTSCNINLYSSIPSSFKWTIGSITGYIVGATPCLGNTLSQYLTSPSNSIVGTVQYIVTPTSTSGLCVGSSSTITVTVNPAPMVTSLTTGSMCSGANSNIILYSSIPSSFSWTIGTIVGGITGVIPGQGNVINQILNNPSNAFAGPVTYIVTPTSTSGTCVGSSSTITVTVNPTPKLTNTLTESICSGTSTYINLTASVPSNFYWKDNIDRGTICTCPGPGPSPNPIKQMLLDTSHSNSGTEQIIIIPISNSGCTGSSSTITVTVNPTPVVTNSAKETISSGTDTNINLTSSVPSSFTWTIGTITGNITGASPGSGVSINQILTNPSSTATGTVQYIITPTSVIGFCPGPSYTITVTVNPHT